MDQTIICRCEEVSLEDIQNTASKYDCSAREVKLRTRAGMGYCGGRTCRPAVDAVLEAVTGEKAGHDIPLKVQPPIRPVSLSLLGGENEMTNRILNHPVLGKLENQTPVNFTFDGQTYEGFEGDTIASALLANGIRQLRVHEATGTPRAIYCNIGHCFECRVTVNQSQTLRACMTPIQENMAVESGKMQPAPFNASPADWPRTYAEFENMNKDNKDGDPHA